MAEPNRLLQNVKNSLPKNATATEALQSAIDAISPLTCAQISGLPAAKASRFLLGLCAKIEGPIARSWHIRKAFATMAPHLPDTEQQTYLQAIFDCGPDVTAELLLQEACQHRTHHSALAFTAGLELTEPTVEHATLVAQAIIRNRDLYLVNPDYTNTLEEHLQTYITFGRGTPSENFQVIAYMWRGPYCGHENEDVPEILSHSSMVAQFNAIADEKDKLDQAYRYAADRPIGHMQPHEPCIDYLERNLFKLLDPFYRAAAQVHVIRAYNDNGYDHTPSAKKDQFLKDLANSYRTLDDRNELAPLHQLATAFLPRNDIMKLF